MQTCSLVIACIAYMYRELWFTYLSQCLHTCRSSGSVLAELCDLHDAAELGSQS